VAFMSVTNERKFLSRSRAAEQTSHGPESSEFNPYYDTVPLDEGFMTVATFAERFRVGQRQKARAAGRTKGAPSESC
jgi:hypothetical protein